MNLRTILRNAFAIYGALVLLGTLGKFIYVPSSLSAFLEFLKPALNAPAWLTFGWPARLIGLELSQGVLSYMSTGIVCCAAFVRSAFSYTLDRSILPPGLQSLPIEKDEPLRKTLFVFVGLISLLLWPVTMGIAVSQFLSAVINNRFRKMFGELFLDVDIKSVHGLAEAAILAVLLSFVGYAVAIYAIALAVDIGSYLVTLV